jgi:ABC-type nitrate/sulfonate/bicarbonate transport system permease component
MTWPILIAFVLGALLGLSIGVVMTRRMRRELEELVTILR